MTTDPWQSAAQRHAILADPTRLRLLTVLARAQQPTTVKQLTARLAISQSTCSHHVKLLHEAGLLELQRRGTATLLSVGAAQLRALPHPLETALGLEVPASTGVAPAHPEGIRLRGLAAGDWDEVREIYREGIATGIATFATEVPSRRHLRHSWLPEHRWVATDAAAIMGWAALLPVSQRSCYSGVAETSIYVAAAARGRHVGTALLQRLVSAAGHDGFWTLQAVIFAENRASLRLHAAAGFRVVGLRERLGYLHGRWRDVVLMERRERS